MHRQLSLGECGLTPRRTRTRGKHRTLAAHRSRALGGRER